MAKAATLHLLTFDLEEWFYLHSADAGFDAARHWDTESWRAESILLNILDLLKQYQATATFFCMGEFARKYPDLIKRIAAAGHEIGAHSDQHQYACFQNMQLFEADLIQNINTLKSITDQPVLSYRTPAYSVDTLQNKYQTILKQQGILFDSSAKAGFLSVLGKLPNRPFSIGNQSNRYFFPVSTLQFLPSWPYGGSGFFRLLPQWLVNQQLNRPGYHMLYFHPRDFDPAMYHLPKQLWLRWKYGLGTKAMLGRLEAMLRRYPMYSIEKGMQTPAFKQLIQNQHVA
ncbi:MAG: polysaccharide deacetylase family protein [Bacteroidia bacterium]